MHANVTWPAAVTISLLTAILMIMLIFHAHVYTGMTVPCC